MAALKLFWESVPNAVSYNIYYGLTTGVTTTNGILISNIQDVVFRHINLQESTRYFYIVAAVDSAGNIGPPSVEFSALTGLQLDPPSELEGIVI